MAEGVMMQIGKKGNSGVMYLGVRSVATEGERAGQTETVKARHYNMRNVDREGR